MRKKPVPKWSHVRGCGDQPDSLVLFKSNENRDENPFETKNSIDEMRKSTEQMQYDLSTIHTIRFYCAVMWFY